MSSTSESPSPSAESSKNTEDVKFLGVNITSLIKNPEITAIIKNYINDTFENSLFKNLAIKVLDHIKRTGGNTNTSQSQISTPASQQDSGEIQHASDKYLEIYGDGQEDTPLSNLDKNSKGSKILKMAKEMINNHDSKNNSTDTMASGDVKKGKIKMSCWDWANEVYERLGLKMKTIYENYGGHKNPPQKEQVAKISIGDRLVIKNGNKTDPHGEHSVIFAGWGTAKDGTRTMKTYSFSGVGDPRYKVYKIPDNSYIRGIIVPA